MVITAITTKNDIPFRNLAPKEMLDELVKEGHFGIGAVYGTEEKGSDSRNAGYAVGLLLFEVREEEGISYVALKWLYVAREYRGLGIGNTLMEKFYQILEKTGVEGPAGIVCDVPMPEEYDLLCDFLEKWNFRFEFRNLYECKMELGELLEYPFFEDERDTEGILPLKNLPKQVIQDAVRFCLEEEGLTELPAAVEDYDLEISCAAAENGCMKALFLVGRHTGEWLEPVLLHRLGKTEADRDGEILDLLYFTAQNAAKRYSEDTQISLVCRSRRTGILLDRLFPDRQPSVVRHGEYIAV